MGKNCAKRLVQRVAHPLAPGLHGQPLPATNAHSQITAEIMSAEGASRGGYGRQGPLDPHRHFRTERETFALIRLLSTRAFVIGTPLRTITRPRRLAHARSGLDLRPVFST